LVLLGLQLRNAVADECAGETTGRSTDRSSAQQPHDRACRDERADAGNRQAPDACEPSESATEETAGPCAGRGAFRRLRPLLVCEIPCPLLVGEQRRDVA